MDCLLTFANAAAGLIPIVSEMQFSRSCMYRFCAGVANGLRPVANSGHMHDTLANDLGASLVPQGAVMPALSLSPPVQENRYLCVASMVPGQPVCFLIYLKGGFSHGTPATTFSTAWYAVSAAWRQLHGISGQWLRL